MKVSSSIVNFRIDIDFPESDVDVVLIEMASRGVQTPILPFLTDMKQIPIDKTKLDKTPTEGSVDFALNWLAGFVNRRNMTVQNSKWDVDYGAKLEPKKTADGFEYMGCPEVKTELEEIGIKVESWYGLMQGCCHLNCEVDSKLYSNELVAKANKIVEKVFKKFVKYHKSRSIKKQPNSFYSK